MRPLAVVSLVIITGCAHVAHNYPPQAAASLPDKWNWRDSSQPIVVDGDGYRGFFAQWDDMEIALAKAEHVASLGSVVAARDAKELREVVRKEMVGLRIAMFCTHGKVVARSSDFLIEFADGTTVRDSWSMFSERNRADAARHDSRRGPIEIDRRYGRGPVMLVLFVPREHLGKLVVSVNLKGGES